MMTEDCGRSLRASVPNAVDREIDALRDAYLSLASISPEAQARGLDWLIARFAWEHRRGGEAATAIKDFARRLRRPFKRRRAAQGPSA